MKHLGILKNSFKRVRVFQIELEFGGVGFWVGRKTGLLKKTSWNKKENQQKTHMNYHISRRRLDLRLH